MLTCWRKELNMIEGNACSYFHPMWKLTFHTMATKVLWTTSWDLVHLLPWMQHKKWIPIMSMGCVHTHPKILAIEGWGSPNHIWNVMKKIRGDNLKAKKIGQIVNQAFTLESKHDKIWAQWILDIMSKNMLEIFWWCKCFKMESWNWTICYSMNCSNGRKHAWTGGNKRWHVALRCCWKGKVLLLICVKTLRRKKH